MTGFELKELLIDERVKFVNLALKLGITPPTLQAKFKVKKVSSDLVTDIEEYLGKEPGYLETRLREKTSGAISEHSEAPKQDNTERLIALLEKQSEQIGTLIARIDRLIEDKR